MARATTRGRPEEPADRRPGAPREPLPPKPAADHRGAVGDNLPWPFAAAAPPEGDVVGIEIFEPVRAEPAPVESAPAGPVRPERVRAEPVRPEPLRPESVRPGPVPTQPAAQDDAPTAVLPAPDAPAAPAPPLEPPPGRRSFLTTDAGTRPAEHGWRGAANRFGLALPPSRGEEDERRNESALGRSLAEPRTIAVVNGKGGSNKTPTTAVLAAVLARYSGAGVLAWDNNETRGTLGWRTEAGAHEATVRDLLDAADDLLAPAAGASDLARYVHHQAQDRYDVLRSAGPRGERLSRTPFDAVHRVARKYYRIVVVDSGNDESAERWRQMIERADRLVVATTALGEHAESGALLLEELAARGGHSADLARRAVVVVSQSDPNRHHGDARQVARELRAGGTAAVVVPYDRSLHSGRIRFESLRPASRRAWLAATVAVADGM